jgi:peptidoglycan/LPS O-acetylase OafA/YrhL
MDRAIAVIKYLYKNGDFCTDRVGSGGKILFLEGMRGIGALFVVLGHCTSGIFYKEHVFYVGEHWYNEIYIRGGLIAVNQFFCLSGFVLLVSIFKTKKIESI